jgi:hypothetical protein
MSDTIKAAHNVAIFKREGFVVVEVEVELIESYTEERALRIVSAHPWVIKKGLPVLVAWIDDEDELQVHGDEDAAEAAEEMGLDYESIKWSQEITVSWPDPEKDDDEDVDDEDEDEDEDDDDEDDEEDDDDDETEGEETEDEEGDEPKVPPAADSAKVPPKKGK